MSEKIPTDRVKKAVRDEKPTIDKVLLNKFSIDLCNLNRNMTVLKNLDVGNFTQLVKFDYLGFDAGRTRLLIAQKAIKINGADMTRTIEVIFQIVKLALVKGNKIDGDALSKLRDTKYIKTLLGNWGVTAKGPLKPTNWSLTFPLLAYYLIVSGLHLPAVYYEDLDVGLCWSGGSSICSTTDELAKWRQWARKFSSLINNGKEPTDEEMAKIVRFSDTAYNGAELSLGLARDAIVAVKMEIRKKFSTEGYVLAEGFREEQIKANLGLQINETSEGDEGIKKAVVLL
jgi:hypothetical protein